MTDSYYRDTDARMAGDVDFRACVMQMMRFADLLGFTPGELKQIAFRAALELEMRRPGTWVVTQGQIEEIETATRRRIGPDELRMLIELANKLPPFGGESPELPKEPGT